MKLQLTRDLLDRIEGHGEQRYPEEAAGLILGRVNGSVRIAIEVLPMDNTFAEEQRVRRYQIDPQAMIEAERQADRRGLELVGVYHSHPDHPAQPSEFDRKMALPWFIYLITKIQQGMAGESRGWHLAEDRELFQEVPLQLERREEES